MFHRQENAPRALRFFQETHHISTKLQSVNLKLYDMMYIANCMKHMSLTQGAVGMRSSFRLQVVSKRHWRLKSSATHQSGQS
jgi:hypothetical protein